MRVLLLVDENIVAPAPPRTNRERAKDIFVDEGRAEALQGELGRHDWGQSARKQMGGTGGRGGELHLNRDRCKLVPDEMARVSLMTRRVGE